ncbi:MAG TPA: hypothetical protein VEQ16_09580 [Acidocella sp.]|jgi:hypothetical protein|nr:hypothetical protein [Acidocella sp.]
MGNDHAGGAAYEDLYPYYAELCALSELRKKPGCGVSLQSGRGGHALLYLNGVQRDGDARRLRLVTQNPAAHGAGISVNSHYSNANWIAIEGRDFLWRGALAADEPVTPETYARTQAAAKAQGVLDGIIFHKSFFAAKPAAMSDEDYMYEISTATDYALQFGRDSFCARIPLDRPRMEALITYLNAINEPYRRGKAYHWNLFNDNCVHVARNALAAAGVWKPWPTGQFFALAAFHFPVPKNAIVDLWRRGNDLPLDDAQALYEDEAARDALLNHGALPTAPGALARRVPAIAANEIYDVSKLKLIFYDNPVWSPYRPHLRRMFTAPYSTDLHANLVHFAARYEQARHRPRPRRMTGARESFQFHYEAHLARAAASTSALLARLEHAA